MLTALVARALARVWWPPWTVAVVIDVLGMNGSIVCKGFTREKHPGQCLTRMMMVDLSCMARCRRNGRRQRGHGCSWERWRSGVYIHHRKWLRSTIRCPTTGGTRRIRRWFCFNNACWRYFSVAPSKDFRRCDVITGWFLLIEPF